MWFWYLNPRKHTRTISNVDSISFQLTRANYICIASQSNNLPLTELELPVIPIQSEYCLALQRVSSCKATVICWATCRLEKQHAVFVSLISLVDKIELFFLMKPFLSVSLRHFTRIYVFTFSPSVRCQEKSCVKGCNVYG